MLSTSLPAAVFVVDGVAIGLVRPRAPHEVSAGEARQSAAKPTSRLSQTPRWLTRLREVRAS
jgi:hypothetical protein